MTIRVIFLGIIVATTIWVAFDAADREWPKKSFADREWKWAIGMLLLWIVVFPMYLVQRRRAPKLG